MKIMIYFMVIFEIELCHPSHFIVFFDILAAGNQLEIEEGFDLFTDTLSRILLIMIYLNDEIYEDALEAIQKLVFNIHSPIFFLI